ncbi:MAG: hypothetical protein LBU32_11690 [Clostridiales bacterium]|nr:hypothetical protein [Clostridiales bacterium]
MGAGRRHGADDAGRHRGGEGRRANGPRPGGASAMPGDERLNGGEAGRDK